MSTRTYLIAGAAALAGASLALGTVAASPEVSVTPRTRFQAVATSDEIYLVDLSTGETWVPNHVFGPNEWVRHIQPFFNAAKPPRGSDDRP